MPIWVDFMREAHEGLPIKDFEAPPGIEFFNINRRTGTREEIIGSVYCRNSPSRL